VGINQGPYQNVANLGKAIFTTYLFAFEITSALLVIAVVGAVVLARRSMITNAPRTDSMGNLLGATTDFEGADR
jgi:hypothetical protein